MEGCSGLLSKTILRTQRLSDDAPHMAIIISCFIPWYVPNGPNKYSIKNTYVGHMLRMICNTFDMFVPILTWYGIFWRFTVI